MAVTAPGPERTPRSYTNLGEKIWPVLKQNIGQVVTAAEVAHASGLNRTQALNWLTRTAQRPETGLTTRPGSGEYIYRPPAVTADEPEAQPTGPLYERVSKADAAIVIVRDEQGELFPLGPDVSARTLAAIEALTRPWREQAPVVRPASMMQPVTFDTGDDPYTVAEGMVTRSVAGMTVARVRGIAAAENIPADAEFTTSDTGPDGNAEPVLRWRADS